MCPLGVVVMSIERGFKGTSLRMYHRIHVSYIYLHVHYIYHKIQPNARKYITHMDPIGYAFHTGIFSESTRSLRFLMVMVVFYIPSHPKTKRMLRTLKSINTTNVWRIKGCDAGTKFFGPKKLLVYTKRNFVDKHLHDT